MAKADVKTPEVKLGRPPKKVRLRIIYDPALGMSNTVLDIEAKKVPEVVADIKRNGYTVVKGNFTHFMMPASIYEVSTKDL